jgi:hypothetical protein
MSNRITRDRRAFGARLRRVLARIIHEGLVNNPGLPGQELLSLAAGQYTVVLAGDSAVSRGIGDA